MTFRSPPIYRVIFAITVFTSLLSLVDFQLLASVQYILLIIGTVVIGIPHGAADNSIFYRLSPGTSPPVFYISYIANILAYGLIWFLLPVFALIIFLLNTFYHFGQSNLFYAAVPERRWVKKVIYFPWGAFCILPPILFQYEEAAPIVQALIGTLPPSPSTVIPLAPIISAALFTFNALVLIVLWRRRCITGRDTVRELLGLGILVFLYAVAPLFVSFIVYWAFWHALNSAVEIVNMFNDTAYRPVRQFYRAALPLSLITFIAIAPAVVFLDFHGDLPSSTALFFGVIAALTVPRTFVMEILYRRSSKQQQTDEHPQLSPGRT